MISDQLQRGVSVENIAVGQITPNSQQPRKEFRPEALDSLAASIREHGILQPLIVTKTSEGYELIAGERRWRAAKQLGLEHVPALVRSSSEQQKLELALIENLQRDDLTILETAEAFWALAQQFNLTYEKIGERVGRSLSSVKNIIRLLGLPENAKEALQAGTITEGHARQVLALKDPAKQQELLKLVIERGWSVRQAEQFAKTYKEKGTLKKQALRRVLASTPATERWQKKLGAPVHVQHTANASRLIIDFPDEEALNRWTDQLF
jgi:ParB family chromosome partitioning protein